MPRVLYVHIRYVDAPSGETQILSFPVGRMMQLSLQNFSSLVQTMAASVQASSRQLLDLTVGSVLRAVLEANASVALWMQWLILQVLQTTRAATSTGADLDSWMADFALVRLAAVPATGIVTVSRFTPSIAALVPVGALVRTADGTRTFVVRRIRPIRPFLRCRTAMCWRAVSRRWMCRCRLSSPAGAGNVQVASVTQLATAMPGVDAVSNAAPFQNGLDAEADSAFRDRFANYLDSRSRATPLAIGYAVTSIQQGLQYTIQENQDTTGAWQPGSFVVTVDDGSGTPSATLLATVATAIEAVRPVGSTYAVRPPTTVQAAISLTVAVAGRRPEAGGRRRGRQCDHRVRQHAADRCNAAAHRASHRSPMRRIRR